MSCIKVSSYIPNSCIKVSSYVPEGCIRVSSTEQDDECSINIPVPSFEYIDSGYGEAEYNENNKFKVYEDKDCKIRITNLKDILDMGLSYIIAAPEPFSVDESDGTLTFHTPQKGTNPVTHAISVDVKFYDRCNRWVERKEYYDLLYMKEGIVYYRNTDGSDGWLYPLRFLKLFTGNKDVEEIVIYKLPDGDSNWDLMCLGCSNLKTFEVLCDTSQVTSMYASWRNCSSLKSFPHIDTSNVRNFNFTWYGCSSLTSFPQIDTSNVTSMYSTWVGCNSLKSFPHIDTSNVRNMFFAWGGCSSLTSFPQIDTSNVTSLDYTWYGCSSLTSFPQIDTSNVTSLECTWQGCSSLKSFPHIDTSNVTNFDFTWYGCSSLTSFPHINTSNAKKIYRTWDECDSLPTEPCDGHSGYTFRRFLFDDGTPVPSGDGKYVDCG